MGRKYIEFSHFTKAQIRNFSIVSHVDHGKTTLSDHLMAEGGMLPTTMAGDLRALDYLDEEQKRGITIESSIVSFIIKDQDSKYLINLIDTPGHVDFSGKVAESIRLVDNALVIVDVVEGVMAQTQTVLRQAVKEKLKLVLFLNKMDRLITELQFSLDQIRNRIELIIGKIESIIIKLGMKKEQVPRFHEGTVVIGSALHGWAVDVKLAKAGKTIDFIMDDYQNDHLSQDEMKLSRVLTRVLVNQFISPQEGQTRKFPALLSSSVSPSTIKYLQQCDIDASCIVIIGKRYRDPQTGQIGYISRLLSGLLTSTHTLVSSLKGDKIEIKQLKIFRGNNSTEVREIKPGNIFGLLVHEKLPIGDVLVAQDLEPIELGDINYVQEPVVKISIEPYNIEKIDEVKHSLQEIIELTPNLEFEESLETGELLVFGVGTLQLDILREELHNRDLEVYVSDPIVLCYVIPLETTTFSLNYTNKYQITGGNTTDFSQPENKFVLKDDHNNVLSIDLGISDDCREGLIQVFKQMMQVSPLHNEKVKKLFVNIDLSNSIKEPLRYEEGLILGSKIIKKVLRKTKGVIHFPYYILEIMIMERYLGNIITELNKVKSEIMHVESKEDDAVIKVAMPVDIATSIADKLRRVTDGHVFWSIVAVDYRQEN